jgi:hypothetical protein
LRNWYYVAFEAANILPNVAVQRSSPARRHRLRPGSTSKKPNPLAAVQEIGLPQCSVIGRAERTSLPMPCF